MVVQVEMMEMKLLCNKVMEEEIVEVVFKWIGILVVKMLEGEWEKLLKMEEVLYQRVVGQYEVIKVVFDVICCFWVGFFDFNWFNGFFLFLGLIGVGKIEFCKVLVMFLFDIEEVLVWIDMFEFMEKYFVLWLIGVSSGYVGYEEGGYFMESV